MKRIQENTVEVNLSTGHKEKGRLNLPKERIQKVKRGIRESYEKGYFIGGYGLFGYDIVDKKWTINSYEADIVRDIFTRYKNGEKAKEPCYFV